MARVRVIDRYGNNAAVECPSCAKVFVFSTHINKKNGRTCPHCNGATVFITNDGDLQSNAENVICESNERVREILALVRPLAADFYRLTGKPLGVTGEIAEFVASEILGLTLVAARTIGFDALRGTERIQIKGRAYDTGRRRSQRMSRIKLDAPCDVVLLVLLDNSTLEAHEMWEAPYRRVCEVLTRPGSNARTNGALGVPAFKAIAKRVWTKPLV